MSIKSRKDTASPFHVGGPVPKTREQVIRENFNYRMKQIQQPTKALDMLRETGFGSYLQVDLTEAVWGEKEKQLDALDNLLSTKL